MPMANASSAASQTASDGLLALQRLDLRRAHAHSVARRGRFRAARGVKRLVEPLIEQRAKLRILDGLVQLADQRLACCALVLRRHEGSSDRGDVTLGVVLDALEQR